jgi:hypothetical protein
MLRARELFQQFEDAGVYEGAEDWFRRWLAVDTLTLRECELRSGRGAWMAKPVLASLKYDPQLTSKDWKTRLPVLSVEVRRLQTLTGKEAFELRIGDWKAVLGNAWERNDWCWFGRVER